jgi:hypothetical protein
MTLQVDEAASALRDAEAAAGRAASAHGYRIASSYLILWGVVWTAADVASQISPERGKIAWLVGVLIGVAGGVYLGVRQAARHVGRVQRGRKGWLQALIVAAAIGGFAASVSAIASPVSFAQSNAIAALAVGAIYMALGAGVGLRVSAVGAAIIAITLLGWFFARDYFFLWMAAAGGGGLILGGLWFREV